MRTIVCCAALLAMAAAAFAAPELVLNAELEKGEVAFEGEVVVTVTFENRGDAAVTFFEPLFARSIHFPPVWFVNEADGRKFRPWVALFRSIVKPGIQGALVKLGPGRKKVYTHRASRFYEVREELERDWKKNTPPPPGSYRVFAVYEQRRSSPGRSGRSRRAWSSAARRSPGWWWRSPTRSGPCSR
jgi:hypothetical protein